MPLVNRRRCSEGFARFSRGLLFAMASSENKRKDSYSSRHRSHKGCWTCKRKRVQCDETRPGCLKCSSRGLACEGYELRLRWGAGIASRGRFNGADKPVKESIPPHSKRRWDLRAKKEYIGGGDHQGQPELLLQQECTPVTTLSQPLTRRTTVNILNMPSGEDLEDYIGINKHFELPVSMANHQPGDDRGSHEHQVKATQFRYTEGLSGRSIIIA